MLGFLYIIGSILIVWIAREIYYLGNLKDAKLMKKNKIDEYNKRNDMSGTYILQNKDGTLERRDIFTDQLVTIKKNENGDRCMYAITDKKNGKQEYLRNIDEEERKGKLEKSIEDAINNNKSVALYMKSYEYDRLMFNKNGLSLNIDYAKGDRYIDLETKDEYVIRAIYVSDNNEEEIVETLSTGEEIYGYPKNSFNQKKITYFYMNAKTGLLIRRTDRQIEMDNIYENKYNAILIDETDVFINTFNSNNNTNKINYYNTYDTEIDFFISKSTWRKDKYLCTGVFDDCYQLEKEIKEEEV